MAENESPGDALAELPEPIEKSRSRFLPSLIWLVPLAAAIAGATLLITNWRQAGDKIEVSFQGAEGVEAGKTQVRYKEVVIGRVTAVNLSDDNARVIVHIELDRQAHGFSASDARYWVVRPRIGLGGVSGLGTLLSGAYIGADSGVSKDTKKVFTGIEAPPAVLRGSQGRTFSLHSEDLGSLDVGSPVYFRRIHVGRVTGYQLDNDGKGVSMQLFVDAPYDRYVTAATHFWNASGIDLALTSAGLKVNTESFATVLAGGVAFQAVDALDGAGGEAKENATFELFRERGDALKPPDGLSIDVRMRFNETLRGLAIGSPVDFRGVAVGTITAIDLDYDAKTQTFPANVSATIYPKRLGSLAAHFATTGDADRDARAVFQVLIDHGFRAQARLGSLLTQQLYIALAPMPHATPMHFDADTNPLEIPTAPGSLEELQEQVADILAKLDKVPFDQIGSELRDTLHSTNALIQRLDTELAPEAKAMLASARQAMESASRSLASDSPLQHGLTGTLEELRRAAQSLRGLADYLARHPEALLRGKLPDAFHESGDH